MKEDDALFALRAQYPQLFDNPDDNARLAQINSAISLLETRLSALKRLKQSAAVKARWQRARANPAPVQPEPQRLLSPPPTDYSDPEREAADADDYAAFMAALDPGEQNPDN